MMAHASGHMGVVNTKTMQLLGLTDQINDPVGGKYGRDEDGHLNGYLEEQAFITIASQGSKENKNLKTQILDALKIYASYGITTVQEGYMKQHEFDLLNSSATENKLFLDVVGYVDIKNNYSLFGIINNIIIT